MQKTTERRAQRQHQGSLDAAVPVHKVALHFRNSILQHQQQKRKITLRPQFHYSTLLFLSLLYFTLPDSALLCSTLLNLFSTFSTFSTSAQSPLNLFSTFSPPLLESYSTLLHSILLSPQHFRLLSYFSTSGPAKLLLYQPTRLLLHFRTSQLNLRLLDHCSHPQLGASLRTSFDNSLFRGCLVVSSKPPNKTLSPKGVRKSVSECAIRASPQRVPP